MKCPIEYIIFWTSFLLLLSIIVSKAVSKLAIPGLIIFISIGMLVGSEGPGGVYFDDPWETQIIGTFALITIIFSGGLQTKWPNIRPVALEGAALSVFGVLITAVTIGCLVSKIFNVELIKGLLIGSILSSTDAPAVFALLRAKSMRLKAKLNSVLEFESGSNDPMAVFLTLGILYYLTCPNLKHFSLIFFFIEQVIFGLGIGFLIGLITVFVIDRIQLEHEGLYHVLVLAFVFFSYSVTVLAKGSGYLAVYIMGLTIGQKGFNHKHGIISFHEGLSWLLQIAMFLIMGLLVFPSHLLPFIKPAIIISLILMFIARPLSVFLTLCFSKLDMKEKIMISWVGLRGAVPIVLATFPMIMAPEDIASDELFNVVFSVVLISILIQGATIPFLAKWLKQENPIENQQLTQ